MRVHDAESVWFQRDLETLLAGAAGRFDRLEEVALIYAFALLAVGRAEGTGAA